MRWRRSIGNQRDNAKLGNIIRQKFGPDPLIILGDCSCIKAMKYHPSTKGVGLRSILSTLGFRVVLIDEYRTSTACPMCMSRTATFRERRSRRPWRRDFPPQRVHRLLECTISQECRDNCNGQSRKWNRDLMAVLKFRRIGQSILNGSGRPQDLQRQWCPAGIFVNTTYIFPSAWVSTLPTHLSARVGQKEAVS